MTPQGNQHSMRLSRWAGFATRHRPGLAATLFLVCASATWLMFTRLQFEPGIEQMVAEGGGTEAPGMAHFVPDSEFVVVVEGDVFGPAFGRRLAQLVDELEGLTVNRSKAGATLSHVADDGDAEPAGPSVLSVRSLLSQRRVSTEQDTVELGTLRDLLASDGSPGERLREAALSDPSVVGRWVDAQGRYTQLAIEMARLTDADMVATHGQLQALVSKYAAPDFQPRLAGVGALKAILANVLYREIGILFALSLGVAMGLLFFSFRSLRALIAPGVIITTTTLVTGAAMALAGAPVTLIGLYLPAYLTVVAVGDVIHLQTTYHRLRPTVASADDAIATALAEAGPPVFYTTLTTCLGLLSLSLAGIEAVRQMGQFAAFGTFTALLSTLVVVPLVFNDARSGAEMVQTPGWRRFVARLEGLSRTRRGARSWLLAGAAVALFAGYGATKARCHHEMVSWLPADNPLAEAIRIIDDHLSGAASMTVLVSSEDASELTRRASLVRLGRVAEDARAYHEPGRAEPFVRASASLYDVVASTWRLLQGREAHGDLPPDQAGVDAVLVLLDVVGARELSDYLSIDRRTARVELRMPWRDASAYAPVLAHVEGVFAKAFGPDAEVEIVGPVVDMNRAINRLLDNLIRSFTGAFVSVALALLVFLRNGRLALISLVPNVLPVILILGVLGLAGIPLDVNTLMLSSVVLGIVVDDTIHLLYHFRQHHRQTGDVEASVRMATQRAGSAMLITSLSLALGFLTLVSSSLSHMRNMGVLMALAIAFALLVDLVLTPALLRTFVRDRQPQASAQDLASATATHQMVR